MVCIKHDELQAKLQQVKLNAYTWCPSNIKLTHRTLNVGCKKMKNEH